MQDDCIAVALGLPQLRILKQKELEGHFEVTVIYRRGEVTCPRCGRVTTKEHDRRQQLKQDRRLRDKAVFLFRSRYTLFKGAERLANWEKERLNQLFHRYPELKKAWVLKESFRTWYRETDRSRAEERLGLLEEKIEGDSLPEFKELLHTLDNWREEILNYFDYRITNGFVEGKNNRIKTIKRTAYGYRNMANFRLRILATNPGCDVKVSHLLT